jgi:hypothetical protein
MDTMNTLSPDLASAIHDAARPLVRVLVAAPPHVTTAPDDAGATETGELSLRVAELVRGEQPRAGEVIRA